MNIEIQVKTAGAEIRLTIPTDAPNAPGLLAAALDSLQGREAQEGRGVPTQTDRQAGASPDETAGTETVTPEMKRYARAEVERARRRWKKDAEEASRVHENHAVIHAITAEIGTIERESECNININKNKNKTSLLPSMRSVARSVTRSETRRTEPEDDAQLVLPLAYPLPETLRTPAIETAWGKYLEHRKQRTAWEKIRWKDLREMWGTMQTAHEMAGEPGVLEVIENAEREGLNCRLKLTESVKELAPKKKSREELWSLAGYMGYAWDFSGDPPALWKYENPENVKKFGELEAANG